jgi:ribosomal protein S2
MNKIKKYKKIKKDILFNILVESKNFYGNDKNKIKKEILPFIFGIRFNQIIINLNKTSLILKYIFLYLKYIISKKKKILIIGNTFDIKFLINLKYIKKKKNIIFFTKKWVKGLITNKQFFVLKKKKIDLIIIVKSSINDNFLNKELSILRVPIISIINTEQNIKNINYPIISNTINNKSMYTLMYLIRKKLSK